MSPSHKDSQKSGSVESLTIGRALFYCMHLVTSYEDDMIIQYATHRGQNTSWNRSNFSVAAGKQQIPKDCFYYNNIAVFVVAMQLINILTRTKLFLVHRKLCTRPRFEKMSIIPQRCVYPIPG